MESQSTNIEITDMKGDTFQGNFALQKFFNNNK